MSLDSTVFPTLLVILDGFGHREASDGNAIAHAHMPTLDYFKKAYPWTTLQASGAAVGLPDGSIGNSEVGHLTIGAGRIITSDLKKINTRISDQSFFENELLNKRLYELKARNKTLHLIGLLSDAGVHSHEEHLYALIKLATDIGLQKIIIHPFLDGRDTPPKSATRFLEHLEQKCHSFGRGIIGSLHGRFYAMDRDKNNTRTETCYTTLTEQQNTPFSSWQEAIKISYENDVTDEFFYPQQIIKNTYIKPSDGVIFFNFRPDRARQLTRCFLEDQVLPLTFFITMTRYDETFTNDVLFEQTLVGNTLLDEIAQQKPQYKLFTIAETEKYAHIAYFFRGMREITFPNEEQVLIPSIKTKDYVQHPEMSAQAITNAVLTSVRDNPAHFYLINYANADMVGHSGNFAATIKACEHLDLQLEELYNSVVREKKGTIFITADHGNAEEMIEPNGNSLTAHTTHPVPFLIVGNTYKNKTISEVTNKPPTGLSDIASLILKHLSITCSKKMTR